MHVLDEAVRSGSPLPSGKREKTDTLTRYETADSITGRRVPKILMRGFL
jgi:hypothetical protein